MDSVLVPFENHVKIMLSEHSDMLKSSKRQRATTKSRPHYQREEQLADRFVNARQAMWSKVSGTWAFRSQETLGQQLALAMQGVQADGQVLYPDPDCPGKETPMVFNIASLKAGLCPQPLLDHSVWKIDPG